MSCSVASSLLPNNPLRQAQRGNLICPKSHLWESAKWKESEVTQSCLTLCDPMDTRLLCPWDFLGKSTGVGCHFLLQGTSRPRDWTQVSHIVDRCFTVWATGEVIQKGISFLFSFAFCFSFSQLFVRPTQRAILLFCIFFFLGDGLDSCLLYNVTNVHP